jgi:hypothetical protein
LLRMVFDPGGVPCCIQLYTSVLSSLTQGSCMGFPCYDL